MKRFIVILAVVLLLAALLVPAAFAAANASPAHDTVARAIKICPDRMCPFGLNSCYCPTSLTNSS